MKVNTAKRNHGIHTLIQKVSLSHQLTPSLGKMVDPAPSFDCEDNFAYSLDEGDVSHYVTAVRTKRANSQPEGETGEG
jgi:hypothetical protein